MDHPQITRTKSPDQVESMKKVQLAAENAIQAVIEYLRTETTPTSEEARKIVDQVLNDHDCEFPEGCIVAGGEKSYEPHYMGEGIIQKNSPIVIDIFPRSKETGMFADISRTVCIGSPSAELQHMYDTVLSAQKIAISLVRPGIKCSEIHKAVNDYFVKSGYLTSGIGKEFKFEEGFVHSLGHGVGMNIHEKPVLGVESTDVLQEGDVITIEPGLYYKKIGGVRIEDMLLVSKDGSKNFANFPMFLQI